MFNFITKLFTVDQDLVTIKVSHKEMYEGVRDIFPSEEYDEVYKFRKTWDFLRFGYMYKVQFKKKSKGDK